MQLTHLISSISLSCLAFLALTCNLLGAWASPLPSRSPPTLAGPWLKSRNSFPAHREIEWATGAQLLTKKSLPISLNVESGWTMTFAPYGAFLPLQSVFMILESFYLGAIGRAIGAEVARFPTQQIVNIALGSIGKPFQDYLLLLLLPLPLTVTLFYFISFNFLKKKKKALRPSLNGWDEPRYDWSHICSLVFRLLSNYLICRVSESNVTVSEITELEFRSPTSTIPWEFVNLFATQMLVATKRGFAGRYVTEYFHQHTGQVIVVSLSVLKGSGLAT